MLTKKEENIIVNLNKAMRKMDERQIGRVEGAQMILYLMSNSSKEEKELSISKLEKQCCTQLIKV